MFEILSSLTANCDRAVRRQRRAERICVMIAISAGHSLMVMWPVWVTLWQADMNHAPYLLFAPASPGIRPSFSTERTIMVQVKGGWNLRGIATLSTT